MLVGVAALLYTDDVILFLLGVGFRLESLFPFSL